MSIFGDTATQLSRSALGLDSSWEIFFMSRDIEVFDDAEVLEDFEELDHFEMRDALPDLLRKHTTRIDLKPGQMLVGLHDPKDDSKKPVYGIVQLSEPVTHPDDVAVNLLAAAMKAKLAKKRTDGRGGWQECTSQELSNLLIGHIEKGDPVDVANFCAMLFSNGQCIIST